MSKVRTHVCELPRARPRIYFAARFDFRLDACLLTFVCLLIFTRRALARVDAQRRLCDSRAGPCTS